jgi:hypothetical protein
MFPSYRRQLGAVPHPRLRKKIEMDPKRPKLIKSVHGDGYVFTATVSKFVAARNELPVAFFWRGRNKITTLPG